MNYPFKRQTLSKQLLEQDHRETLGVCSDSGVSTLYNSEAID